MQNCAKCGAPLNGASFCTRCGTPAAPAGQPQQFNNNQQGPGGPQSFNQQPGFNQQPQPGFNQQPQQQFNQQPGFNQFNNRQPGGNFQRQGGVLNIDVSKLLTPGNIIFLLGTLFAVVAALILFCTGMGNIKEVSNLMDELKEVKRGSGFDTAIFVIINFFGLAAVAGTIAYAAMKNRFSDTKKNNIIGICTAAGMFILLIIFFIIRENVTDQTAIAEKAARLMEKGKDATKAIPGGFSRALAYVVDEHMSGMVTFYVLAMVTYAVGILIDMFGISKITFGGPNNGGFNGQNNGGFNAPNNGGFNAPNNGGFNAPNNGGFNAPNNGGFNAPNNGGFNAPNNGGFNAPNNGGFNAPNNGGFNAQGGNDGFNNGGFNNQQ
ncbi:MAG: zinc ribbon domain-containing protein [Oscillospiraceae bacterium]|nr:zinc ribbon domain-containing protein [Oscillospiraceae bacterium]